MTGMKGLSPARIHEEEPERALRPHSIEPLRMTLTPPKGTPPTGTPPKGERRRPEFERKATDAYPPDMSVTAIFQNSHTEDSAVSRLEDSAVTTLMDRYAAHPDVEAYPLPEGGSSDSVRPQLPGLPLMASPGDVPATGSGVQRQLAVVSLSADRSPASAFDDFPSVRRSDRSESNDGYIHTIVGGKARGKASRALRPGRGYLGVVARWACTLFTLLIIGGGLVAAASIAYTSIARPEIVLSLAPLGGLVLLGGGAILLHLFGVHRWWSSALGVFSVMVLALALVWVVRLAFPLGLAESVFRVTVGDVIARSSNIAALVTGEANSLFLGYLPFLWAGELIVFCFLAVRCFRFLRGRSASVID